MCGRIFLRTPALSSRPFRRTAARHGKSTGSRSTREFPARRRDLGTCTRSSQRDVSMKTILSLRTVFLLVLLGGVVGSQSVAANKGSTHERPEIAYLETINALAPPQDPQLLFILMGE